MIELITLIHEAKLADIVYRIQTITRLLFLNTSTYKIFATESERIVRQAVSSGEAQKLPSKLDANALTIEAKCNGCGDIHKIYAKLAPDPDIDKQFKEKGFEPFPKTNKLMCECGHEIDLSGFRNEMEARTGKKFIV